MTIPVASLFDLKGRVALVTGAAMGIGEAIALRLAEAGAHVMVADINARRERVAEAIRANHQSAGSIHCDLGSLDDIREAIAACVKVFGSLDIVVNTAGEVPFSPALETAEYQWDRVVNVNVKGAFFLAQRAATQMIKQGQGGTILNVATIDALHPTAGMTPYDASKGALVMLTKSLGLELAPHHIRVNAIAPGIIATPGAHVTGQASEEVVKELVRRIPLHRVGQPDEIAMAALYLASRAAAYITGSTLVVDGGLLLS